MKYLDFFAKYWSQFILLITAITGAIGFLVNLLIDNRNKRRHKRYDLYQEKKLAAYISFNTAFIDITRKLINTVNEFEISVTTDTIRELKPYADDLYIKVVGLSSFLKPETAKKYDGLLSDTLNVFTDLTNYSIGVTAGKINPHNDPNSIVRLYHYNFTAVDDLMKKFVKLKEDFQKYYRD